MVVVAVGNDGQFEKLCEVIGKWELVGDERFVTNAGRVENREELISALKPMFLTRTANEWLTRLENAGIPYGPINTLDKVFAMPNVEARDMLIHMEHAEIEDLKLVGSPLKFSETPVDYKLPPPRLGEHIEEILNELFG